MSDVRAVVSDLDGTFWWGRSEIHASTLAAVRELAEQGIELLFATGRRRESARRGLEPLGLLGPTVLLSGALGADLASGEEWHRQAFTPTEGAFVMDAFEAEGLSPVVHVSTAEVDSIIGPDVTTCADHMAQFEVSQPGDARGALAAGDVVGFGVCGLHEPYASAMHRVADHIQGRASAYVGPDHIMSGTTLMVAPRGISKVAGIEGWLSSRGLDRSQVLAVGDGSNDIEMLAWAGTSVAVAGDAAEQAGADHTIPHPCDGGWAHLLDLV